MGYFSESDIQRRNADDTDDTDDTDTHLIHVTFFPTQAAQELSTKDMTLEQLRDLVRGTSAKTKGDLPWLKLAKFGDKRTDKNCLRNNPNVIAISGIELDYDAKEMSFEDAIEMVEDVGLSALLYTSASYTAALPKWRIVLPTSCELPPGEREKLVMRVNGIFNGIFASESFTLSQAFYYGSVNSNPLHRAEVVEGDFIDQRTDLDAGAMGKTGKTGGRGEDDAVPDSVYLNQIHSARVYHPAFLSLAARKVAGGMDAAAVIKYLRDLLDKSEGKRDARWHKAYDSDIPKVVASAVKKYSPIITTIDGTKAPAFSEEDLALRFADLHWHNIRYVAAWGKWYCYDQMTWKSDETRKTFSLARDLCRAVAVGVNKSRDAKTMASAKTRAAVVGLAGEDRRLAATVDQWDTDPWLLNTPGGVVDLRTGARREHRPDDYMTKITSVAPGASCPTPLWTAFLEKVTDGDEELKAYLVRVAGYALTGSTREHALFFNFGNGRNGKGVFVSVLIGIMGDYHRAAPIETFTETHMNSHPTDLAMLRGARLVTSTETEEGRRWAESRVKMLTGGDVISARFMRQDFFEYAPQFKLMISGNHKPGLRSVDEAIKARFNLIPFAVFIKPEDRDKDLGLKLVAEYPGILSQMIRGCMEWQKVGLSPPKCVTDATEEYLNAEDAFTLWRKDCCVEAKNLWTRTDVLFLSWSTWAEFNGEAAGSSKRFSQRLEAAGFEPARRHEGRGFAGLSATMSKAPIQQEPKWEPPM
jgi:putative DNA primase/helicase